MWGVWLAVAWASDGQMPVRVLDPDWEDAEARSSFASVVPEPPDEAVDWVWEPVPHVDVWPSVSAQNAAGTSSWHAAGHRGAGVRVAVFDMRWYRAEADTEELQSVETADCWTHRSCEVAMDTLRPRFAHEEGVHGYACAEQIRDLAPDVELFAVRVNGLTTFENAVAWAIRNDIDIISMSMSFFHTSFYDGTGPFDALVRDLDDHDILLVTSAGNYADQHWSGPWKDEDRDGRLDFDGDNALTVRVGGGSRRAIYVAWDEYDNCGVSDLDAWLVDSEGLLVGRGESDHVESEARCRPQEILGSASTESGDHTLEIRAVRLDGRRPEVDIFVTSGAIESPVSGYSMVDPASHPLAFAVGAIGVSSYDDGGPRGFSSRGPLRSASSGPAILGPDGLDSDAYGAEAFFGTSAATPVVAGAAALVLSARPDWTPRQAGAFLRDHAEAMPGYASSVTGAGRLRLPEPSAAGFGCTRTQALSALWILPFGWFGRRRGAGCAPQRSTTDSRSTATADGPART